MAFCCNVIWVLVIYLFFVCVLVNCCHYFMFILLLALVFVSIFYFIFDGTYFFVFHRCMEILKCVHGGSGSVATEQHWVVTLHSGIVVVELFETRCYNGWVASQHFCLDSGIVREGSIVWWVGWYLRLL